MYTHLKQNGGKKKKTSSQCGQIMYRSFVLSAQGLGMIVKVVIKPVPFVQFPKHSHWSKRRCGMNRGISAQNHKTELAYSQNLETLRVKSDWIIPRKEIRTEGGSILTTTTFPGIKDKTIYLKISHWSFLQLSALVQKDLNYIQVIFAKNKHTMIC